MQFMIHVLVFSSLAVATVRPLEESLVPLAKRQVDLSSQVWRNPFDEHVNTRINSDNSGNVQNEEQACISPIDPENMVAVWRDFRLGYRRVGFGFSNDNGASWQDELFPQMYEPWQSDPCLAVDADGIYTANVISFDPEEGGEDGLLDISSYDGGQTWRDSVWAAYATVPIGFEDKQMITIDVSGSEWHGSRYVAWAHFYGPNPYDSTNIWFVYKRPGQPYSAPIVLSHETGVQWANVCVGALGEVYVTWVDYSRDGIMFSRSMDGGQTWNTPVQIQNTSFVSANINPNLLIFAYGAMACDLSNSPQRGRLYMIFTDGVGGQDTDVYSVYSDNNGQSWSARNRLNDDAENLDVDQFHPWISVDDSGRVWTAFYDRRNDPQNNLMMDLYFTLSENGGQSWRANERITTVSSDPSAGSLTAGLIGEYVGWCARHNKALAVWTDTRDGNQDVYSTVIDSVIITAADERNLTPVPSQFTLAVFPNPFNSRATFSFTLLREGEAELSLSNTIGEQVFRKSLGRLTAGTHRQEVDFGTLSTGIYVAKVSAGGRNAFAKALLIK